MAKVFISYARKDKEEVYPIVDMLEKNGIDYWIDKNGIESGDEFKKIIIAAINECKVFLYMLSSNSFKSNWVKKEYDHANRKSKIIIPIFLKNLSEDEDVWDEVLFDFGSVDYVDTNSNSEDWKEKLLRSIIKICGKETKINNSSFSTNKQSTSFDHNIENSKKDEIISNLDTAQDSLLYDIVLTSIVEYNKYDVVKVIMDYCNMSFAETIKLIEAVLDDSPIEIKKGISKDSVNKLKKNLEDAGATVDIKESGLRTNGYNVILTSVIEYNKIHVVKAIMDTCKWNLSKTNKVIDTVLDNVPTTIKKGISKGEANILKKILEDAGATVEIKQ